MGNKRIDEYNDKYGGISKDFPERFMELFHKLKMNKTDLNKLNKSIKQIRAIEYETISFIFYFTPQATPRPRYSRFSHVFYVKNALNYNEYFGEYIKSNPDIHHKIVTPCIFDTVTYAPLPSGMNKEEQLISEMSLIPNISKPDWDNLGKTYSDMVQKHLILDDSLIFDGRVRKFYSSKPRIEIRIDYMSDFGSKYNRRKITNWSSYKDI